MSLFLDVSPVIDGEPNELMRGVVAFVQEQVTAYLDRISKYMQIGPDKINQCRIDEQQGEELWR